MIIHRPKKFSDLFRELISTEFSGTSELRVTGYIKPSKSDEMLSFAIRNAPYDWVDIPLRLIECVKRVSPNGDMSSSFPLAELSLDPASNESTDDARVFSRLGAILTSIPASNPKRWIERDGTFSLEDGTPFPGLATPPQFYAIRRPIRGSTLQEEVGLGAKCEEDNPGLRIRRVGDMFNTGDVMKWWRVTVSGFNSHGGQTINDSYAYGKDWRVVHEPTGCGAFRYEIGFQCIWENNGTPWQTATGVDFGRGHDDWHEIITITEAGRRFNNGKYLSFEINAGTKQYLCGPIVVGRA